MQTNSEYRNPFDSANLFEFFYRWRKPLIIVVIASAIISSVVSLMIKEKFKSTVIMFPVASNAISKALLSEDQYSKEDILQFGEEEQAEQMLQILNSDEIRSRVCQKFNLAEHYHIDPSHKFKNTALYDEYTSNITFKRTEFMSVKVDVLDEDPKMAADIANHIADLVDTVKARMQHDRAVQAYVIVRDEFESKKQLIDMLTDSMRKLNSYGMYDYESQSEMFNEQYNIAVLKGDQRAQDALLAQKEVLTKYGSAYMSVRENLYILREQFGKLRKKYSDAIIDKDKVLPYKFTVDRAYPAERKAYPVRWLIVTVSVISSLVMAVLLIIFIDNVRRIRRKEKELSPKA